MPQGGAWKAAYNSIMRFNTRLLGPILTSAYLSAMLTSSVAPIRNSSVFAAAVDPTAVQKALQTAISGLDAASWAAAVNDAPSPSQTTPTPIPVKIAPKADPVMTDELMARLIKYTRELEGEGTLGAKLCKVVDLCDGTKAMPLKLAQSDSTDGNHYFGLPLDPKSKDVLFMVVRPGRIEVYLTDKAWKLRAAAVSENKVARLITNEKAAEGFKAELSLFAGEAAGLPPTGTAVAGNS